MPASNSLSARLFPSFAVLLQSRPESSFLCSQSGPTKSIPEPLPHLPISNAFESWTPDTFIQSSYMAEQNSFGTVRPRVPSIPFTDRDSFSARNMSTTLGSNNDGSLLSPYAQEHYALLEQVLRKDDSNGTNSVAAAKLERSQDTTGSPLMGPEFYYFSDIMAEAPPPSQNLLHTSLKTNDRLYAHESDVPKHVPLTEPSIDLRSLDSAAAATDLSSGIESLCASNEPDTMPCREHQQQQKLLGVFGDHKGSEGENEFPVHSETLRQFRSMFPFSTTPVSRSILEAERDAGKEDNEVKTKGDNDDDVLFMEGNENSSELRDQSPFSNISMTCSRIESHPDLYENLSPDQQARIDALARKIGSMPRRKLRESLAEGVTIEDVEPLMIVNRDELAGMLGLGVTTWKMFVHNSLGVPRWPARALKSQTVKENKILQRLKEAEARGDQETVVRMRKEHTRVVQNHMKRRRLFRAEAKQRSEKNAIRKKR